MRKNRLKKGYVHIYTGFGKGKTTASIGLAFRAASAGFKVCMFQFLKKRGSASENCINLPNFKVVCFDHVHPIFRGKGKAQNAYAKKLSKKISGDLKKAERVIKSRQYDVVILDEIINCVSERFIKEDSLLALAAHKPKATELIMTGRGATEKLVACADYVSELQKIKHPFDAGIFARRGIEY